MCRPKYIDNVRIRHLIAKIVLDKSLNHACGLIVLKKKALKVGRNYHNANNLLKTEH